MEDGIAEGNLNIKALTHIFFEKNKLESAQKVDAYDILASMVFGQQFLTKEERIQKARALNPEFFEKKPEPIKKLIGDMLNVYSAMDTQPFTLSQEFWQTPQLRKYGSVTEIQTMVGGSEALRALVGDLQNALYDTRIAA